MRRFIKRYPTTFGVIWVLLLFVIAYSYAMFQGGFVSWFVFFGFLPILFYTLIVAFYPLSEIHVTREVDKDTLYAGESLKVTLTLHRKIPLPIFYLLVSDELPNHFHHRYQKRNPEQVLNTKGLFSLGFRRKEVYHYTIENLPRGEFQLDKVTLKTGDLFGFIKKYRTTSVDQTVVVYPQIRPLTDWLPPAHNEGGRHRSKKSFEYDLTSVSSVRDYVPGDRLSWLDWKATARTNKLVTKQFEFPLNRDVVIVLDRTRYQDVKIRDVDFERAVSLSASLLRRALISGSSAGFVSLGDEGKSFPLDNSRMQEWLVLNHLAKSDADGNETINQSLKKMISGFGSQPAMAFVTTQLNDNLQYTFQEMMSRGLSIELFLVMNNEFIDQSLKNKLIHLEMVGVRYYIIDQDQFDDSLKAGVQHATS